MTSIRDIDTSALETAEYESMKAAAAKKTYAELVKAIEEVSAKLKEQEQPVYLLRRKLDAIKEAIAARNAELAFEPSITAKNDPQLKRLEADQDRLTADYRHAREATERYHLVARVARDELQRRGLKRDKLVEERCFAEWKKLPYPLALDAARRAVVNAMLSYCGNRTTKVEWVLPSQFMEQELHDRVILTMALQREQEERQRQEAIVVSENKHLG